MARNATPKGPIPIGAVQHGDKRLNIPTADAHDFITPDIEEIRRVRYERDESLDPQLVWRGKYPATAEDAAAQGGDANDLIADAPPIYIQEKIDPRVLIENFRRQAGKQESENGLLPLFPTYGGSLNEIEAVEFYKHDTEWANRMILGDSLQVMASLSDREKLRGKVQMIYIDPPYGIDFSSNWQASIRNRTVKDGRIEDASREAEQIKAFRDVWELGVNSYLTYLRDRMITAKDLLTANGSIFIQISDDNVHLVRSLLDEVFGHENAHPPIIFRKKMMPMMREPGFESTFDYILWYQKDRELGGINSLYANKKPEGDSAWNWVELPDGSRRKMTASEINSHALLPEGSRVFQPISMLPRQYRPNQDFIFELDGVRYSPPKNSCWSTTKEGMRRLALARRLHPSGKDGLRYVYFSDDYPVGRLTAAWMDAAPATDQRYVVETNARIIERCMLAVTHPGDLILDPTCGSGTTAFVAESWGRRWITIDTSRVALALARQRLTAAQFPWRIMADSPEGRKKEAELSAGQIPATPTTNDIRLGFVYGRAAHITLGSITNNPDIKEGMNQAQIDAAIRRHADYELLYDRTFEDPRKIRVSGPFTIESLSPHRALSFGDSPESLSEVEAAKDADAPNFEQSILDNLAKAGIQNGRKNEKFVFASFETYAGSYIQAVGERLGGAPDAPSRIAIAIGPQYGTVSASFVKKAAREAISAEGVDLLAILGFAFDPQVTGMTEDDGVTVEATDEGFATVEGIRELGRIPVLMVRMNADLLMGEELKKTGSGNLFTVFGEPDIEIRETTDGWVVDLKGVDVYDPTTGEVRSDDTGRIAMWMIDTNYNEESFFVRHCYFTGGNEPYKRLKIALKADIDEDAWETLYQTVSRPFPKPETGKIAVKVINDYGDEVMKVIEV